METSPIQVKVQYASFWTRFWALCIDAIVLAILGGGIHQILTGVGEVIIWFFYAPFFECSDLRATPGKYLLGIQVCDLNHQRISLQRSLLRNVVKILSSALCGLGYLLALFTAKHQTLHDLVAETIVVNGKNERSIGTAWVDSIRETVGHHMPHSSEDRISKLERLQSLHDRGALSQEEFEAEKKKILGN